METIDIIDVTVIEPKLKHPTIFNKFDDLEGGQSLIIYNDHDPKPLYYQLLGERGNIFKWEYLEEGPDYWRVKISKFNPNDKEATIGEMVKNDYRKAEIFKKYGIDFCCGGKKTVSKSCQEKGVDVVELEKELKALDNNTQTLPSQDFDSWELDFLADYILNTHHRYIIQANPVIFEYTQKVQRVHGERNPELVEIASLFMDLMNELNCHMMKEENILFPYIKNLAISKRQGKEVAAAGFGTVANPISMMELEHDAAGEIVEKLRNLTNNYAPPSNACNTYRVSFAKLKEYQDDLFQHIHLENNILFPKAIALEKELLKA
ncbi:MAG: iron-sulfur cluster repair di-iron protein [Bacteroidetes bacterium]|nr:iron-sulfur cluster repair di-iron protein [Bacteroidota bacterium]